MRAAVTGLHALAGRSCTFTEPCSFLVTAMQSHLPQGAAAWRFQAATVQLHALALKGLWLQHRCLLALVLLLLLLLCPGLLVLFLALSLLLQQLLRLVLFLLLLLMRW